MIRFVEEQEGRQQSERRNAPIKTKEEEEEGDEGALSARLFMYFSPHLWSKMSEISFLYQNKTLGKNCRIVTQTLFPLLSILSWQYSLVS